MISIFSREIFILSLPLKYYMQKKHNRYSIHTFLALVYQYYKMMTKKTPQQTQVKISGQQQLYIYVHTCLC
jgi:hypothetical protein